jgi:hypothetical protein
MIKKELEDIINKQEVEIATLKEKEMNSIHLSSAIEAKDIEINDLKNRLNTVAELEAAKWKKEIDKYRKDENYSITELKKEHESQIEKLNTEFSTKEKHLFSLIDERTDLIKVLIQQRNEFAIQYGNLLKILQGALDTHMFVNDVMNKEIENTIKK